RFSRDWSSDVCSSDLGWTRIIRVKNATSGCRSSCFGGRKSLSISLKNCATTAKTDWLRNAATLVQHGSPAHIVYGAGGSCRVTLPVGAVAKRNWLDRKSVV